MKLKFDANLQFQQDAINAVCDLFTGLPPRQSDFELSQGLQYGASKLDEGVYANALLPNDEAMLKNLHTVQQRNQIEKSTQIIAPDDSYSFPNFSVEMETGTGKTYVYLRTIFELHKRYGYSKFIIVVPSVAIREGVTSSIRLMTDHFKGLYNNVSFNSFVYSSDKLGEVNSFAVSSAIQIMIINIQAFRKKDINVIHQERDNMNGGKPIEYIQRTRPIVIIDEPQSVDTAEVSKDAIKELNPLLALRYSATHINPYNLVYRLDPIQAYDMGLVKQIEVDSIRTEDSVTDVYLSLESIGYPKNGKTPQAKVKVMSYGRNAEVKKKPVTLKHRADLADKTNYPGYEGYRVTRISLQPGDEHVEFANGVRLEPGKELGGLAEAMLKEQVRLAVQHHFEKEKRLKGQGIKVLTLFFVHQVKSYRLYNEDGSVEKGMVARWFEEVYNEFANKQEYMGLIPFPADEVHNGYFSVDKKKGRVIEKDTSGSTQADEDTYHLIMQDKEKLLSNTEPLRFIFSHSALKEGWDNPNVFQICSLRDMNTERQRRQTLGRGLRLPVNQNGERVHDRNVNRLTVIASESFEQYARGLQTDYERECGIQFGKVSPIAFANVVDVAGARIGQEQSKELWQALIREGYLLREDNVASITDVFDPERPLALPDCFKPLEAQVKEVLKGFTLRNRIQKASTKRTVRFNKRVMLNEDFKELWQRISQKTRYRVQFSTQDLIDRASAYIQQMPDIEPLMLYIDRTEVDMKKSGIDGKTVDTYSEEVKIQGGLPDILAFLQRETELTRQTLLDILARSGKIGQFRKNPQSFMTAVSRQIKRALNEMIIDGIQYEKIPDTYFLMEQFELDDEGKQIELTEYLKRLYEVQSKDNRTPYDSIVVDSEVEREIAQKLDQNENVKFFCKLPHWFKVPTPIGSYNPDWAVVTEHDNKLYLVRETKSTHDPDKRRASENQKIQCGQAHFDKLDVDFAVAVNVDEVLRGNHQVE